MHHSEQKRKQTQTKLPLAQKSAKPLQKYFYLKQVPIFLVQFGIFYSCPDSQTYLASFLLNTAAKKFIKTDYLI